MVGSLRNIKHSMEFEPATFLFLVILFLTVYLYLFCVTTIFMTCLSCDSFLFDIYDWCLSKA